MSGMTWGQRARQAVRRSRQLARTGAIRVQRAVGEQATRLRKVGRRAAVADLAAMRTAGLDVVKGGELMRRGAAATIYRERGPLPDPAWVRGYADVVAAVVPGVVPQRPEPETELEAGG